MLRRLLFLLLAASLATLIFAQPNPDQPAGGGPGGGRMGGGRNGNGPGANFMTNITADNTIFEINAFGIFIIHNGVVAKYNANLNPVGVKELFDPLPPQPKPANPQQMTDAERKNAQDWLALVGERDAPFSHLIKDEFLHLVIGSHYFKVNMKTLAVDTQADLTLPADPNALANPQRGQGQFIRQAPMLKLDGATLFVLDTQALFAVNTANGAVTNAALPKEMFPSVDFAALRGLFGNFNGNGRNQPGAGNPGGGPGGNRPGGGGGGDGNRGGNAGGNPPPQN